MAASSSQGSSSDAEGPETRTAQDILLNSLEDITEKEFKRFKDKLSDFSYGDKAHIPRGKLECADSIDTKNYLIDYYGLEDTLEVTVQVFKAIGLMGPAGRLQEERKKMYCRRTYMECVKQRYQLIEERNSLLGDTVHLKKIYTRLLLIKKHCKEEERQHEITATGRRHLQIMADRSSKKYSPTTIQALFDPDEHRIIPRTVVLAGPAGIGKTLTAQKIMLDWASGDLYQDKFSYVFYVNCREINNITDEISIASFLSEKCQPTCQQNQIKCILRNPSKLLFVIDGLDELKWSHNKESEVCKDPFQKTRKEVIFNSLFRKQVLEEASLIITTRPFALEKMREYIKKSCYVEILGFTEKDREQFFYHFFENKEQADMALNAVKENDILFAACSVPIISWIVCTVMKPQMGRSLNKIDSKTSTSVYMLYLKSLLKYHGPEPDLCVKASLRKLCALAKDGIWNRKILFEKEDISKHGLTMSDIRSLFLNENIFQKDIETYTCYSFIHLSVQEFLGALYYVLSEGTENWDGSEDPPYWRDVRTVLKLYGSFFNLHLALTVRFLFGLFSEQQINTTKKLFGCKIPMETKHALEQWLKENKGITDEERMNCLYETQDVEFVKRMMSHFLHLKITGSSVSRTVLSYCLTNSTSDHTIHFYDYIMVPKSQEILSPALHSCKRLVFKNSSFPGNDITDLVKPHHQNDSNISWLCNSKSRITELELEKCSLTSANCEDLCYVITNRSLTKLDLSRNNLQDSGVKLLCDGLRHPRCTLRELGLRSCGLTSISCEDLRSVIFTNQSLTKLKLKDNKLQDSGVKLLCDGLRHPDCKLKELGLSVCGLTSASCEDLRSVIITNRSLTRFVLSYNNLQDSGVKRLCDGLRHPDCTLQELRLRDCGLTSASCEGFRSVIVTNRSLTSLKLNNTHLQDSGVELICDGLKHPDCTLQQLRLQNCFLTSASCGDLRSVIITNRSLTRLELSNNTYLGDSGVKLLCEGLRHPDCTLQELGLAYCGLTSASCEDLCSVIITNRSLTRLDLSRNNLQDSGVKLLCDGLRHPDCTLQELKLRFCGLTSANCICDNGSCSDDDDDDETSDHVPDNRRLFF
ncbi:NACHT, LRR and PYD domains-containing protein 12-like [Rhinophrynus dorsalis]